MVISSSTRKYEALLLLVTLVAAAGWVFTKSALAEFSPYWFLALRFLLAAAVLALLCYRDLLGLRLKLWWQGLGTGAILAASLLTWILAVDRTDSIGEGAFIVSLTVVFVPLVARLLFSYKITRQLLWALLPAVAGLAVLTLKLDAQGVPSFKFEAAHWLFLVSTGGFALHVVLTGRYAQDIPYLSLSTLQLLVIGVIALIAAGLTETWPEQLSPLAWTWLLCSAFIATSLRFALQTKALGKLDPNSAAMLFILEPVWTALLAGYFLAEEMSLYQLSGCFMIFLALIIYRAEDWLRLLRARKAVAN